ncbi:MAG TPA: vWA domain-containing protein [Gaiellaceae bacterium]|nr:vWA domain-containing protein [Gaiellaceae bacterium]
MKPIPYGELGSVARSTRRTLLLRVLLAVVAIGAAAAVVVLGRGDTAPAGPLPAGTDGLVVLDLSASISTDTYARISATLDELADSGGRYGLIVFSDTAYLALPPGTPAAELRAFARRFDLPEQTGGAITVPTNPWTNAFSAGTKISTGLQLALDTIEAKQLGRPAVLLVSDLDDDVGDLERLTSTALAFRRLEIPVRVVGLNAAPEDERYLERLLRRPSDLSAAPLPDDEEAAGRGELRLPLLLAAVAAAAALALRELLVTRVERA